MSPGPSAWTGPVGDAADPAEILDVTPRFTGSVWSVRTDEVRLPGGAVVRRDLIDHPGAVGVAVLDDDDRILMIRQYRHPVGGYLFELPAGLRDVDGEHPLITAQRELAEEGGRLVGAGRLLQLPGRFDRGVPLLSGARAHRAAGRSPAHR
jgi:ADP-ribose pyrophosphatase